MTIDSGVGSGRRLRFDVLVTSASGLAIYGLALITGPLLARALGPAGRGDLAAVVVPTQVIGFVLLFGLPHAAAYYVSENDRTRTRRVRGQVLVMNSWLVALVVSLPLVLVMVPLVPVFLDGHSDVTIPWFYAFLGTSVLFLPMSTALDVLRADGRSVAYNVLRSLLIGVNFVGVVVLAVLGELTLTSALASAFAAALVALLATLYYTDTFPTKRPDLVLLRRQLSYGWRAAFGTLSQMVLSRFDQFLLVALVDNDQLGLYVVAVTGASLSSPIGQGIALALFPHVRSSDDRADANTRTALVWAVGSSAAVALVVALCAPWGIPLLFGDDFQGSVAPLLWLLPGQVALDAANVHASRLEADGRPGLASIGLAAGAALTVLGLPLVVPRFGIEGAAVVASTSYVVYLVVVWSLRRRSGAPVTGGHRS